MSRRTATYFLLVGLLACAGELQTPGEPLHFIPRTPEPAIIGEPYNHNIPVAGGLSPYAYRLAAGTLPPGLTLQGGAIRGVPTETGSFTFTIEVSDANLSVRPQEMTIEVREPPPPALILNVPLTEMREPFRLRVEVDGARELRALRTELRWDVSRFSLSEGSLRALQNNLALFDRFENGILNVDLAALGGNLNGRLPLFEIELVPTEPSTIQVEARSEFYSVRATGQHAFQRTLEGVSPVPPEPEEALPDEEPEDDVGDDVQNEENGGSP